MINADNAENGVNGIEVALDKKQAQIDTLLQIIGKNPFAMRA